MVDDSNTRYALKTLPLRFMAGVSRSSAPPNNGMQATALRFATRRPDAHVRCLILDFELARTSIRAYFP